MKPLVSAARDKLYLNESVSSWHIFYDYGGLNYNNKRRAMMKITNFVVVAKRKEFAFVTNIRGYDSCSNYKCTQERRQFEHPSH